MCEDDCECSETLICWSCFAEAEDDDWDRHCSDDEDDGPYDTWQEWELDNE